MTAVEIMKSMEEMDNSERIKVLNLMFDNYFDTRFSKEQIVN